MQNHLVEVLRQYPNWVAYQLPDKKPRQIRAPEIGASVDAPNEWVTYDEAAAFAGANPGYGLGFVLTPECGLSCVDLDNVEDLPEADRPMIVERQTKIYNELFPHAYAELSPSGKGCHLWVRGTVDTRKGKKIEVYSQSRYITVTCNAVKNVELPQAQQQLDELVSALDRLSPRKTTTEAEDSLVLQKCCNSDKFNSLWAGNWQGSYPSQSEADAALIFMLAQWSSDIYQIERLFLRSALGERLRTGKKKKHDSYILDNIRDALRNKTTGVNTAGVDIEMLTKLNEQRQREKVVPDTPQGWPAPPGLVGDVASFIWQNAIYPNVEVALAGAIAFVSGIAGRAYNTNTGTGLNQYVVLVGGTSQGKEAAARGVSVLSDTVTASYKAFDLFMGPAGIASPQGLLRRFEDSKSFVCRIGEFGHWMQRINNKNASSNDVGIRQMLLDVFTKSGSGDILPGSVYADRAKNVPNIKAPALTLLGDTTPEEFYKGISEANIAEGLISRLSIITVPFNDVPYNENGNKIKPSKELLEKIAKLGRICIERMASDQAVIVNETAEARSFQLDYQKRIRKIVLEGEKAGEKTSQIWHRAHLRLLRMGALLAVGENPDNPVVNVDHYKWAQLFIDRGCSAVIGKYNAGEIGINTTGYDMRQEVERVLVNFAKLENSLANQKAWQATDRMLTNHVINRRTIQLRIMTKRSYKEDRNSATTLNNILRDLEMEGVLVALESTAVENPVAPANYTNYYTPSGQPSKAKYWGIDSTVLNK